MSDSFVMTNDLTVLTLLFVSRFRVTRSRFVQIYRT